MVLDELIKHREHHDGEEKWHVTADAVQHAMATQKAIGMFSVSPG